MTRTRLFAAAMLATAAMATPALAQDITPRSAIPNPGYNSPTGGGWRYYHPRVNRGFWPGDVAAGVVGGAIGTAGAIATAPFDNGYSYYDEEDYDPAW